MSDGSRPVESHCEEKQVKPEGAIPLNPGAHERRFSVYSFLFRKPFHDKKMRSDPLQPYREPVQVL